MRMGENWVGEGGIRPFRGEGRGGGGNWFPVPGKVRYGQVK